MTAGRRQWWERARRWRGWRPVRRGAWILGGVVLLVVVAAIAILSLTASREWLLRRVLDRVAEGLPGEFTVAEPGWPHVSRLAWRGVLWTDQQDTLLVADTVVMDLGLAALLRRDLVVTEVRVGTIRLDLPRLQATLAAAANPPADADTATAPPAAVPWIRPGAVPELPSLAVRRLEITDAALLAAPDTPVRVDTLGLHLEMRAGHDLDLAVAIRGLPTPDIAVAWALRAGWQEGLTIRLAPLDVRTSTGEGGAPTLPPVPDPDRGGSLRLAPGTLAALIEGDPNWPRATLDSLVVRGDLGHLLVSAATGRDTSRVALRGDWAEPPRLLLTAARRGLAAAGSSDSNLVRILSEWERDWSSLKPSLRLDATAPTDRPLDQPPPRVDVVASFRLPGPHLLAPLLPPQTEVDDLRSLVGSLRAGAELTPGRLQYHLDLDLGETPWLAAGRIIAAGTDSTLRVDSLALALPEFRLTGSGLLAGRDSTLVVALEVPDLSLLSRRWRDPALADLAGDLKARLDARGSLRAPAGRLELAGSVITPQIDARSLVATVDLERDSVVVDLNLPRGLTTASVVLDRAAVQFAGRIGEPVAAARADTTLSGWFSVDAAGHDMAVVTRGDLSLGAVTAVSVDTLAISIAQEQLKSTRPFGMVVDTRPEIPVVELSDLDLKGSLGTLRGDVRLVSNQLEANVEVDVPDLSVVTSFVPDPALEGLAGRLKLILTAGGSLRHPQGYLELDAAVSTPRLQVPSIRALARVGQDSLTLDLQLPEGLRNVAVTVDTAAIAFDGRIGDLVGLVMPDTAGAPIDLAPIAGVFAAVVLGPDLGLTTSGDLNLGDLTTVNLDTLTVTRGGTTVNSTRPIHFQLDRRGPSPQIVLEGLDLTGDLGTLKGYAWSRPDSLAAELDIDLTVVREKLVGLLPPETVGQWPPGQLAISGQVRLAGTPIRPRGNLDLEIGLTGHPAVGAIECHARAELDSVRVVLEAGIDLEGSRVARLDARYPVTLSLAPFAWTPTVGDSVHLELHTDRLDAARFAPLMGDGVSAKGTLQIDLGVRGIDQHALLSGGFDLRKLAVQMPDGSRFLTNGGGKLTGTVAEPDFKGSVDIVNGLLRLPDLPPSLLPVEGRALLWAEAADSVAAADSLQAVADSLAAAAASKKAGNGTAAPPTGLTGAVVQFDLNCPGDLWLRGHGLDLELAGDLTMHVRGGAPSVNGQLRAKQGSLKLLGRFFKVDQGTVEFYPDEQVIDPELNVRLSTKLESTTYYVEIFGRAQRPQMKLTSEPPMPEADIVSSLLFGKPVDDLDSGQEDLMRDRAQQILLSYGSTVMGDQLSRELGLDMVSIQEARGRNQGSSLVVGKYLSPSLMVKYERVLEKKNAYYVTLELNIRRILKLMTPGLKAELTSGEASGIDAKWSKDW